MMQKDLLSECPLCHGDGCYITFMNESAKNYMCFGCGFTSNDLMKVGEFDFEEFESEYPELYKDIAETDSEGRKWYPAVINLPEQGTVFANGTSKENWQWAGILLRELTEAEKEKYAKKNITHLIDTKSQKLFGRDFIEACDYIGLFKS